MKRAVFKIGKQISITSTYKSAETAESFRVPINVQDWLKDDAPPWDFDIEPADDRGDHGVDIEITDLMPGASSAFSSGAFLQNLRRTIGRDYSLHLNRGLKVDLNDEPVAGWQIELLHGDDFEPVRFEYEDETDGDIVSVEVIGGMSAPPPDSVEPSEASEDDGERRFGWYVICNGRIVLAADKTALTVWGHEGFPQWHRQYSGFIGLVFFTSANAGALPLTTTKRSVDVSSEVYRRARPKMRDISRTWVDYTNARKQAIEEAKRKESNAAAISIYNVVKRDTVSLPRIIPKPKEPTANVNYSVPVAKMKALAKGFGNINMPYRDVGLKSFEYAFDDLAGED